MIVLYVSFCFQIHWFSFKWIRYVDEVITYADYWALWCLGFEESPYQPPYVFPPYSLALNWSHIVLVEILPKKMLPWDYAG